MTIFINGGAPDYLGFKFTTGTELLDKLEFELVNAGWTSLFKVSGSSLLVQGNAFTNNHNCYVEFTVINNGNLTNGRYLTLTGWQVNKNIASVTQYLTFVESTVSSLAINRLWLTADQEAGCLAIFGSNGSSGSFHFGFLDRVDTTDQWAWMVGHIHTLGYSYACVAKCKYDSTNWKLLANDYYSSISAADSYACFPLTTVDFMTRGKCYDHAANADNRNAFYYHHLGRMNYDGKPVITPYSYLEGRGANSNYQNQTALYFRGNVKFAYCGVSSVTSSMTQFSDSRTGYRILVPGSQWQGMRIL